MQMPKEKCHEFFGKCGQSTGIKYNFTKKQFKGFLSTELQAPLKVNIQPKNLIHFSMHPCFLIAIGISLKNHSLISTI